ncbi:hypothetical protein KOW79_000398 [Hemibagrus wyckioides]|uniref:Uncharacterized protein n=1 Tax=Hemibagrus wyckioides TaxID=337641 RepID=A0A9D3SUR0_9TELE|nr:hypothetical protein KOW79_000398 [Hemibagrus wyckioides]
MSLDGDISWKPLGPVCDWRETPCRAPLTPTRISCAQQLASFRLTTASFIHHSHPALSSHGHNGTSAEGQACRAGRAL